MGTDRKRGLSFPVWENPPRFFACFVVLKRGSALEKGCYRMRKLAHSVSSLQQAVQPQTETMSAVHPPSFWKTQFLALHRMSSAVLGTEQPQLLEAPSAFSWKEEQ